MIQNEENIFNQGKVLLVNKEIGWTSFDVVKKIKNLTKAKKVGHAGTLDPLAEGLLIVCTGKKTKEIASIQNQHKTYLAEFTFGYTTPSFDLETQINEEFQTNHLHKQFIEENINEFKGEIEQIPPIFSAVKIKGKRAYELAREGLKPKIEPKKITIHQLELISFENNKGIFFIECSKGTYIRSLARDMGKGLNTGACMTALKRTQIGEYSLENALTVKQFAEELNSLK